MRQCGLRDWALGGLRKGCRRVSACRGDRDGTVEARMVGLCVIIYALYWQNR